MTLTIEMAGMLIGTLVSLAGFAWGIMKWVIGQLGARDLALLAESARAKEAEDALAKSLADHKLYAAEHFATAIDLEKALQKVEFAINRIADRLDALLITPRPSAGPLP